MELQVTWMAILLIVLASAHIAEEIVAEFRNACGAVRRPAMQLEDLTIERLGPLAVLVGLAVAAALVDDFWLWIALGMVAVDLMTHASRSVVARSYTPGIATGALGFAFILWLLADSGRHGRLDDPSLWGAMMIGAAFTIIHLSARCDDGAARDRPADA